MIGNPITTIKNGGCESIRRFSVYIIMKKKVDRTQQI